MYLKSSYYTGSVKINFYNEIEFREVIKQLNTHFISRNVWLVFHDISLVVIKLILLRINSAKFPIRKYEFYLSAAFSKNIVETSTKRCNN